MKKFIIGGFITIGFLLLIALALQILIAFTINLSEGALKESKEAKKEINIELETIEDSLKVSNVKMTKNPVIITGIVKNTNDFDVRGISVIVSLYDKDHIKVGESSDYIESLKKTQKWRFRAVSYLSNVKYFEVAIKATK